MSCVREVRQGEGDRGTIRRGLKGRWMGGMGEQWMQRVITRMLFQVTRVGVMGRQDRTWLVGLILFFFLFWRVGRDDDVVAMMI